MYCVGVRADPANHRPSAAGTLQTPAFIGLSGSLIEVWKRLQLLECLEKMQSGVCWDSRCFGENWRIRYEAALNNTRHYILT